MHQAPLFPVAAGLILGIVLEHRFALFSVSYYSLLVTATMFSLYHPVRKSLAPLLIGLASIGAGGLLYLHTVRAVDPDNIELCTTQEGVITRVRGVVVSEPRSLSRPETPFARWSYHSDQTTFLLEVESIEGVEGDIRATGTIRVTVREPVLDLRENERVELFGRLYAFRPPANPGSFDWSAYYRRQGVSAGMTCPHRENIVRLMDASPDFPQAGYQQRLRAHVRGLLTGDLTTGSGEAASLLDAMILGHRSRLDRKLNDIFIRAGCVHFLAVSGLHLAIPMSFVWFMGRLFSVSKRRCAWLMIVIILAYLLIAEPRPSILRASVMGFLFSVSIFLGRPRSSLNWLSASAIVLVLYSPVMVFDIGFQLSFICLLGIIHLSTSLRESFKELRRWFDRSIFRRPLAEQDRQMAQALASDRGGWSLYLMRVQRILIRYAIIPLAIGIGAWLATLPIVAGQFYHIYGLSPIHSILLFPGVYIFVLCGLMKIGLGALYPGGEIFLSEPLLWIEKCLIQFVDWLGALPGSSVTIAPPPWWWVAAYYLFLVLFAFRFPRRRFPFPEESYPPGRATSRPTRRLSQSCTAACILFVICTVLWCRPQTSTDRLVVTTLSVGAGSATIIELPDGRTVIYDTGSSTRPGIGRSAIVPFLRQQGIRRIDRVYLSHANIDHYNALLDVMEAVPTGTVFVNEYFLRQSPEKSPAQFLLTRLQEMGQDVRVLDPNDTRWNDGGVTFELLWPTAEYDETLSPNDASIVLRLTYRDHSILLTGDIEERAQRALLDRGDLHADVLVLPHHGSVKSSSPSFIDAVGASAVIRSSHERMSRTYNGIDKIVSPTALYNTADVGAVRIVFDRDGVRIHPTLLSP